MEWPNPQTRPEPTEDPTKEKQKKKLKGCCLDILTSGTQAAVESIFISFSGSADVRYHLCLGGGGGGGECIGLLRPFGE